jgi:hypothetical protein
VSSSAIELKLSILNLPFITQINQIKRARQPNPKNTANHLIFSPKGPRNAASVASAIPPDTTNNNTKICFIVCLYES